MTLIVENLAHAYGRFVSLDGISVAAAPGRITAVLGPNAAGKSTLLRCVIGALKPCSGQVRINDLIAHRTNPRVLAQHIAYVPQRSLVSAAFAVRQVVELGRYALPPDRSATEKAIDRLDLGDVVDRPYPNLSVGQQQRVALARAVAQLGSRGHLILDEPIAAMDLRHVRDAMILLRELATGGATVLLAMHDLPLATSIADDVWLMDSGRLVAAGPTTSVLTKERLESVFGVRFTWIRGDGVNPISRLVVVDDAMAPQA